MKRLAILVALISACARPSTYEQATAARLAHPSCPRSCPVGEYLSAPDSDEPLDCCYDPIGMTWSRCAWNTAGRYMSRAALVERFDVSASEGIR